MKRALALVFILIAVFLLITLELRNPDDILVYYYFGFEQSLPLLIIVLVPFLLGLLIGAFFVSLSLFKSKRNLKKTQKDLANAEQEVSNLRAMPINDQV